jgi:cell division inhibitor SepF
MDLMQHLYGTGLEVVLVSPRRFQEAQRAVLAVREQKFVVLQAQQMEPDLAQRTIDFVAGGVQAIDGQAERLDATTFLFAPALVRLSHMQPKSIDPPD